MSRNRARAEASPEVEPAPELVPAVPTAGALGDEIGSLARELARGHRDLVDQLQRYAGMGPAEAAEAASAPRDRALELAATEPPGRVTWTTLAQAARHEPADALAAWERVKVAARQEWQSGHRAAQSLERAGTPWERARFLALREAFRDDWRPRGGVEAALVDLLAQHFGSYLRWSERLALHVDAQCATEDATLARDGYWMPPRLSEARWMRWCAEQAEAAHRRFLMTLKALQDLRRLPAVSIASVGQVNIAQQQLNVAADENDADEDR